MGKSAALIAVACLVAGFGVGATEAASPADTTIHGCYDTASGQLRVLRDSADVCNDKTETALSWNAQQVSTRWYRDWDGDGYGDWYRSVDSPAPPPGYVGNNTDCNDNLASVHPGVEPDIGPGDLNCNGVEAEDRVIAWRLDADHDGWGGSKIRMAPITRPPVGYVYRWGDCNDQNAKIHPYQAGCHPGGDIDGDGHRSALLPNGDDCNDADPSEFAGRSERRDTTGHDEDCDPLTGGVLPYDPNFGDPRVHTLPKEVFHEQYYFGPHGNLIIGTVPASYLSAAPEMWQTPPLYRN